VVTVVEPSADDATLAVQWTPVAGTLHYDIEVVQDPPAGPSGGSLTVYSRSVQDTSATVPRPVGRSVVSVAACNLLGCGLPVVTRRFEGTTAERSWPLVGVPSLGSSVETPFVVAWLPATGAESYRVVVKDADTGELELDATTERHFFPADLPPYRSWRIMVTAVGADVVAAGTAVVFRTTSVRELTLRRPLADSVVPEGLVTLEWTGVPGATAYEYLVTAPGGRRPAARGVTDGLTVEIELAALNGPTSYSAIVRACPSGTSCRGGRDRGWGPWSTEAGTGAVNFAVVPSDLGGEGEP
jgi:hypothetical protein